MVENKYEHVSKKTLEDMLARGISEEVIAEYDRYLGLDYDGTYEMYLIGETNESVIQ